ncbi:integrase [Staphylococcus simulans]|uniref:tyrosine-type recombinase/integrase n=1 Tax=Staphylococcus simulans TaxID=1286 RepID=UPI000D0A3DD6|nr:tyrosine-type recombinase/integrase [Staphylococcus simulans]AVO03198.1 integrase [Staphylococcus simulans]AVO06153.1 integrase [Staphylococcus simulans]AWG19746.1 integrase [Staphylococcus simulans]AWI02694.1 integrase [Staphylococcus simulans]
MDLKNIKSLNLKKDKWVIEHKTSLGDTVTFDFTYLPNDWFKKVQKEITIECITIGKPSLMTMYRYNYSLGRFFEFISQYGIELNTFEDLTYQYSQMYLYHLKQQKISNSTMAISLSALKWLVLHGQHFEYEGFPTKQIFDGDEYKAVKTEDILKTKYVPDKIMEQIERALKKEENKMLKVLIEIGIDTGIRLSEALDLTEGCLTEDFTGKPVLHVISKKNNTERFIPVSTRVRRAIKTLGGLSKEGRAEINSDNLTVYWLSRGRPKRYDRLIQSIFRPQLKGFIERHKITNEDGSLYPLSYHAFRHTLGTEMLNRGMTSTEIADYLGHESLHSTAGYAKLKNPTVQKEYKKLGFIGVIVEEISEEALEKSNLSEKQLKSAALPDGACAKPIDNKGNICANYNMCIICPKFITTPKHLSVHKDHLARLQADREQYMSSEYIGPIDHLNTIENTLGTIIERLEEMDSG